MHVQEPVVVAGIASIGANADVSHMCKSDCAPDDDSDDSEPLLDKVDIEDDIPTLVTPRLNIPFICTRLSRATISGTFRPRTQAGTNWSCSGTK